MRPEDETQLVDLLHRVDPEWPTITLDRFRYRHDPSNLPAGAILERTVADLDGRVVATKLIASAVWTAAPGRFNAGIAVDQEHRGRGIGSRLYESLVQRAEEVKASHLYAYLREDRPESQEFAFHRGFAGTGHSDRESRLDVGKANFEGQEELEKRLSKEGIHITTLAAAGTHEDMLQALYRLECDTVKDVPASEPPVPFEYPLWRKHILKAPGRSPDCVWVALDGRRPVSAAYLVRIADNAMGNGYTCTHPQYRGRGLARALKARSVRWAQENAVEYIYTDNDVENTRMLDINVRLGYKPMPSTLEVVKNLEPNVGK